MEVYEFTIPLNMCAVPFRRSKSSFPFFFVGLLFAIVLNEASSSASKAAFSAAFALLTASLSSSSFCFLLSEMKWNLF